MTEDLLGRKIAMELKLFLNIFKLFHMLLKIVTIISLILKYFKQSVTLAPVVTERKIT